MQIRQHEEKIKDYFHELNKPVARHADDKDLEDLLKKQEREGKFSYCLLIFSLFNLW